MSVPKDAREALEWWDAGELVSTVEMGGLGPGYEQAIHVAVFETIRLLLDEEIVDDVLEETVHAVSIDHGLQLSGAQGGVVQALAYQFLTRPWNDVLDEAGLERRIIVSKTFPGGSS